MVPQRELLLQRGRPDGAVELRVASVGRICFHVHGLAPHFGRTVLAANKKISFEIGFFSGQSTQEVSGRVWIEIDGTDPNHLARREAEDLS